MEKNDTPKSKFIDYYYCDERMAISKGIKGERKTNIPKCSSNCLNCLACIVSIGGEKLHVNLKR